QRAGHPRTSGVACGCGRSGRYGGRVCVVAVVGPQVHQVDQHAGLAGGVTGPGLQHHPHQHPVTDQGLGLGGDHQPLGVVGAVGAHDLVAGIEPVDLLLGAVYSSTFPRVEDFSLVTLAMVPTKFFRSTPSVCPVIRSISFQEAEPSDSSATSSRIALDTATCRGTAFSIPGTFTSPSSVVSSLATRSWAAMMICACEILLIGQSSVPTGAIVARVSTSALAWS